MSILYIDVPTKWPQGRRMTVDGAVGRLKRMLTAASVSVLATKHNDTASAKYDDHFSDPTFTQLARVQKVIALMLARLTSGSMLFHYVPDQGSFDHLNIGRLPHGYHINDIEAFVIQRNVIPGRRLSVYFAPSFFTGNVYVARNPNTRTGTGTFLHELSHGVAGTADNAYTWQGTYAGLTAAQRANNADSYRAYCQSFDTVASNRVIVASPHGACKKCGRVFGSGVKLRVHEIECRA